MTGILLLNFGEPERARAEDVVSFLEAIFAANARLDGAANAEGGRRRARELAERRAPALLEAYRHMGGSPLCAQSRLQARALEIELRQRGGEVAVEVGMQFTEPTIASGVRSLRAAGATRIVGLPLYPLCGPSTTVLALAAMRQAVLEERWDVAVSEVSGWHAHPRYVEIRARSVRSFCEREELEPSDSRTKVVFSAHGTPIRYLEEGSRYDLYVQDHCAALGESLGLGAPLIGYQNHDNRPGVEWTQPDVQRVLREIEADRVIVVPVSFMQEQSETLVELDVDLRREVESAGRAFFRVPVPYDDPAFASLLADLVDETATGEACCRCRPGAFCLNHGLSR